MIGKTLYSAFISSVYEELLDERYEVISHLLDEQIFPVCMEHFTVTSNNKFNDIKNLINISDFFVLLLGERYGSTDEEGVSWTEREYLYAQSRGLPTIAIVCKELGQKIRQWYQGDASFSDDEKKQIKFATGIGFTRVVTEDYPISKILGQALKTVATQSLVGWTRNRRTDAEAEQVWRDSHPHLNLNGIWYHIHYSERERGYIRTGTVDIKQNFDCENYQKLKFNGCNYNIRQRPDSGELRHDKLTLTNWEGEYTLREDGSIFGVFVANRDFISSFGGATIADGTRRGIHDFKVMDGGCCIRGKFHDEAPSPKLGSIIMFRTEAERDGFLKENLLED